MVLDVDDLSPAAVADRIIDAMDASAATTVPGKAR